MYYNHKVNEIEVREYVLQQRAYRIATRLFYTLVGSMIITPIIVALHVPKMIAWVLLSFMAINFILIFVIVTISFRRLEKLVKARLNAEDNNDLG